MFIRLIWWCSHCKEINDHLFTLFTLQLTSRRHLRQRVSGRVWGWHHFLPCTSPLLSHIPSLTCTTQNTTVILKADIGRLLCQTGKNTRVFNYSAWATLSGCHSNADERLPYFGCSNFQRVVYKLIKGIVLKKITLKQSVFKYFYLTWNKWSCFRRNTLQTWEWCETLRSFQRLNSFMVNLKTTPVWWLSYSDIL